MTKVMPAIDPTSSPGRYATSGSTGSIERADRRPHRALVTTREEDAPSRSARALDDRQMSALTKARAGKLDPSTQAASQTRRSRSRHERKARTRLERRPLRGRHELVAYLARRSSAESSMRAVLIVPSRVGIELDLDRGVREGHDADAAETFLLHRAPRPLDEGDRAALAERTEARLCAMPSAPVEVLALKLRSLIGNDVGRRALRIARRRRVRRRPRRLSAPCGTPARR
jgi:hypothetical protein